MTDSRNHNLLCGALALHNDLVRGDQLNDALDTWVEGPDQPLTDILLQQQAIDDAAHQLLGSLVQRHLSVHGGTVENSLEALAIEVQFSDPLISLRQRADQHQSADDESPTRIVDPEQTVVAPRVSDSFAEPTATQADRFNVLRLHAKGGIGKVSVAQDTELNREVAFKELQQRFADDTDSRSRFLREAEITGNLEHPGIVPVYGRGEHSDGRPYYAMRLIQGERLQDAADRFHLGTGGYSGREFRQLLTHFLDVCQVIEYAHSRHVLHRDIKPTNVMLGKFGETLVVDWGAAKAIGSDEGHDADSGAVLVPTANRDSAATQLGSTIGTPAYMSPEQARGNLTETGPASDIYNLGATLYYLLTGGAPIRGTDLTRMVRQIRAGDFPAPRAVNPQIPGALNAICLKAMALEPTHRYASAALLADDVERYLADETTAVYPEPLLARWQRWMRRHPAVTAMVAATLVVGLASAITLTSIVASNNQLLANKNSELETANRAERTARIEAEQAQAQAQRSQQVAESARQKSQAILTFLKNDILAAARPADGAGGLGVNTTIRAALDAAEPQIAADFKNAPDVELAMRDILGTSYTKLGEGTKAVSQLQTAHKLAVSGFGKQHPTTLSILNHLATAHQAAGQLEIALSLHQQVLQACKDELGPQHRLTLKATNDLAVAYDAAGQSAEAITLHEQVLQAYKTTLGPNDRETIASMGNLGVVYRSIGRRAEALQIHEEAVRLAQQEWGPRDSGTINAMQYLALDYADAERFPEAITLYQQVLAYRQEQLGTDHPRTLGVMNNLASAYQLSGKLADAIPLWEAAFKQFQSKLGPAHPNTLTTLNNLATGYRSSGRASEALALFEANLRQLRNKLGDDHPNTLGAMNNLASTYRSAGRLQESVEMFQQARQGFEAKLGPQHPNTLMVLFNLGDALLAAKQYSQALALFTQVREAATETLGPEHRVTLAAWKGEANVHAAQQRWAEALAIYAKLLPVQEARLGGQNPATQAIRLTAARLYLVTGQAEQGLPLVAQWVEIQRQQMAQQPLNFARQLAPVCHDLLQSRQFSQAAGYLRECLQLHQQHLPQAWVTADVQNMLGAALLGQGQQLLESDRAAAVKQFEAAEPLLLESLAALEKSRESPRPPAAQRVTAALQRLVALYQSWEKPAETAKWRARLPQPADVPPGPRS